MVSKSKAAIPYVVLLLISSPLLLFYGWLFMSSFATRTLGLRPLGFTLENWRFLVEPLPRRPDVWIMTTNTMILTLSFTVLLLFIASAAGYALSRLRFTGRRFFLMMTLVLHAFPSVTLLIAIFYVLRALRLYDSLLGVALVKTALDLPLGIWIMKGFFDNVSWDIEMASLIDGCSRFQSWYKVILPLIKPGIAALAIFAFLSGWNEFLLPYIFVPSFKNQTLSVFLRGLVSGGGEFRFVDYGIVTAVGVFYIIPVMLFFIFTQRYLLTIYAGGVKG
ncbi:MAG: carbohydrate ABC transporter permease [Chloroflexota bacterium]